MKWSVALIVNSSVNRTASTWVFCFSPLFFAASNAQSTRSDDVVTIDPLITAYYQSVSGHAAERDGASMLSLFIKGGKISIDVSGEEPRHQLAEGLLSTLQFLTLNRQSDENH